MNSLCLTNLMLFLDIVSYVCYSTVFIHGFISGSLDSGRCQLLNVKILFYSSYYWWLSISNYMLSWVKEETIYSGTRAVCYPEILFRKKKHNIVVIYIYKEDCLSLSLSVCLNAFVQFSRYRAETLQVGPGREGVQNLGVHWGGGGAGIHIIL